MTTFLAVTAALLALTALLVQLYPRRAAIVRSMRRRLYGEPLPRFVPKGVAGAPAVIATPRPRRLHRTSATPLGRRRDAGPLRGGRVVRRPGAVCRVCGQAEETCDGH